MWIISRRTLQVFWRKHPEASAPLRSWYAEAERASWANFHDIKSNFPTASVVGNDRVVFNIKGNSYRLIVRVHFASHKIYIRFVGTHAEYDKIKADTI
jgi:mRNA interferase HigB